MQLAMVRLVEKVYQRSLTLSVVATSNQRTTVFNQSTGHILYD
jgi:hypothetical protein